MLPLPVATGIALEVLAAGVTSGRRRHRRKEETTLQQASSCLHLQRAQSCESKDDRESQAEQLTKAKSHFLTGTQRIQPNSGSIEISTKNTTQQKPEAKT
jgi:hypothetical protein